MYALAQPARQSLSQGQIDDLRLAASKMTGAERRAFMAEMALKYCGGGARLAETVFGWGRETVEGGLAEKHTGLTCFGAQMAYWGRQRWEERQPGAAAALRQLAETQAQQDPIFRTVLSYTRLTAKAALPALPWPGLWRGATALAQHSSGSVESPGLSAAQGGQGQATQEAQRNRYHLRQHQKKDHPALEAGDIKRLSMDCKARVAIGEFSHGALTRGDNKACDHDFSGQEKYHPGGIIDEDRGQRVIPLGSSFKTSDFIVDTLSAWWKRAWSAIHCYPNGTF